MKTSNGQSFLVNFIKIALLILLLFICIDYFDNGQLDSCGALIHLTCTFLAQVVKVLQESDVSLFSHYGNIISFIEYFLLTNSYLLANFALILAFTAFALSLLFFIQIIIYFFNLLILVLTYAKAHLTIIKALESFP